MELQRQSSSARADKAEQALAAQAADMATLKAHMEADMATQLADLKQEMERKLHEEEAKTADLKRQAEDAREIDTGGREPNIKDRLERGDWDKHPLAEGMSEAWWGTGKGDDCDDEVNRLRALARVRAAWPDGTFAKWPQLVVMGDGNTGKSTVLNRFAQFNFSPVLDGICTRRPVRLELRPMSNKNRPAFADKKLDAMVHLYDQADNFHSDYEFRTSHRFGKEKYPDDPDGQPGEPDENRLRFEVQKRASREAPPQRSGRELRKLGQLTASEKHDGQYQMQELVIRYEAPGMIHFDLVDLPGLDTGSQMPDQLLEKYINKDTLAHTFMLIFQAASRGDTRMQYSLCFKHIQKVADAAKDIQTTGGDSLASGASSWIKTHCLGVITMFDKKLEANSKETADDYNNRNATLLDSWLKCKIHEEHLMKFDWVVVLNPNPHETKNNMSKRTSNSHHIWSSRVNSDRLPAVADFHDAYQKES